MNYTSLFLAMSCFLLSIGCVAMDQPQHFLDCGDVKALVYINDTTFAVGGTKRSVLVDVRSQQIKELVACPTYSIIKHPSQKKIALLSTCPRFGSTIITFYDHTTRKGQHSRMPVYVPNISMAFVPQEEASLMFYNPIEGITVIDFGENKKVDWYRFLTPQDNTMGCLTHSPKSNELICSNDKNVLLIMERLRNKIIQSKSLSLAHVCRDIVSLESSHDGFSIAILAKSLKCHKLKLFMYYREYNWVECFERCKGMRFHPNNKDIAILRPNNLIEYCNYITKKSIAKMPLPLNCSQQKDTELFYPVSFSPKGDCILVQVYNTLYRMLVPEIVSEIYQK